MPRPSPSFKDKVAIVKTWKFRGNSYHSWMGHIKIWGSVFLLSLRKCALTVIKRTLSRANIDVNRELYLVLLLTYMQTESSLWKIPCPHNIEIIPRSLWPWPDLTKLNLLCNSQFQKAPKCIKWILSIPVLGRINLAKKRSRSPAQCNPCSFRGREGKGASSSSASRPLSRKKQYLLRLWCESTIPIPGKGRLEQPAD